MNQNKAIRQSSQLKNGLVQTAIVFASSLPLLLTLFLFNHLYGAEGSEVRLGNTGSSISSQQFN